MNQLAKTDQQIDWNEIFSAFGDDEEAVVKSQAAVFLACGQTRKQVSAQLQIPETDIVTWYTNDPTFKNVVNLIRQNAASLIESKLPVRYIQADNFMDKILSADPLSIDSTVPPKMRAAVLKEQGLAARHIYEVILSQKKPAKKIHITNAAFLMDESALDVLSRRMIKDVTPVEEKDQTADS